MDKIIKGIIFAVCAIVFFACISGGGGESSGTGDLKFGEIISESGTGGTHVIKVRVTPGYDNKTTVDQNYYNVADFIRNHGGDEYNEIQYWAVMDADGDGDEEKIISFTVPKTLITKISNNDVVDNTLGNYVKDLYVYPSLR